MSTTNDLYSVFKSKGLKHLMKRKYFTDNLQENIETLNSSITDSFYRKQLIYQLSINVGDVLTELGLDFIESHENLVNWDILGLNYCADNVSNENFKSLYTFEFFKRFKDRINWEYHRFYQTLGNLVLTPEFIREFRDYISKQHFTRYFKFTSEYLDEFIDLLDMKIFSRTSFLRFSDPIKNAEEMEKFYFRVKDFPDFDKKAFISSQTYVTMPEKILEDVINNDLLTNVESNIQYVDYFIQRGNHFNAFPFHCMEILFKCKMEHYKNMHNGSLEGFKIPLLRIMGVEFVKAYCNYIDWDTSFD